MAKKTRKVLKQESQQRAIQQATVNVNSALAASATRAAKPAVVEATVRIGQVETAPTDEYKYVKADLRRIGILAGSFTAILIVLSFFIK